MMMMMQQQREHSQEATEGEDDEDEFFETREHHSPTSSRKKKKKSNNKRRFSDDQVSSLETIFASETKLEPKKKVQVAKDLGLHPRQVAIWFQNKRARWKSKQIEKNYRLLKANYDTLKTRFEAMRKEKETLLNQLQELHSRLKISSDGSSDCNNSGGNIQFDIREEKDAIANFHLKPNILQEEMDRQGGLHYSDDDKSGNMAYLGQDEHELMNIAENMVGSTTLSSLKWHSFDGGGLLDQSNTSSYWWDDSWA